MTNPLATTDAPAVVPISEGVEKNHDIERLRAFAVLFVIVAHVSWIQSEIGDRVWFTLRPWTGVDLFFVISGFVVSNAFERDWIRFADRPGGRMYALIAFYTKRAARILPTAFFGLVFWWLGWMFFNRSGSWGGTFAGDQVTGLVVSNLLFFSNYGMAYGLVIDQLGWYWSLCVEEHFYLLYPSFRLFAPTARLRARALVAIVLVTIFGTRLLTSDPTSLQQLSHNRFDQLAFGVLLFLAWRHAPQVGAMVRQRLETSGTARRLTTLVMALFLFAIATIPTFLIVGTAGEVTQLATAQSMRLTLVVTGLLSLGLVAMASLNLDLLTFGWGPIGRVLFALGTRSYALYMYHLPAKWTTQELTFRYPGLTGGTMPNGRVILIFVIVLALFVEANYRFLEQPFIAWGRRRVRRLATGEPAPVRPAWWPSWRTAKALIAGFLIVVVGVCVLLEFRFRRQFATRQAALSGPQTSFLRLSPTTPIAQVVAALRERGEEAVELLLPASWYLEPDNGRIALSGLSRHPTVLCRRVDGWISYVSDEFGFNNPPGSHERAPEYVLLGDEPAAGVCVFERATIANQLRARGARVVNLALPGSGPFQELGALREFGLPLSPRVVVWLFAEESDIADLNGELRQPLFQRYLDPAFSQHLRDHVADVDAAILARLQAQSVAATGAPLPPMKHGTAAGSAAIAWGHWFDFPALKRAAQGGLLQAETISPAAGADPLIARGLAAALPIVPEEAPPIAVLPYLSEALKRAKADAAASGARLLFVYLPERRHFTPAYEGPEAQVMKVATDLDVPAIDITGILTYSGEPLSFFDETSQYNAKGMRAIAEAITHASAVR